MEHIRDEGRFANNGSIDNAEIRVRLDMSNQQVAYFVERRLREIYGEFARNLMVDCELPEALGNIPIKFETPVFGNFDIPYREYAAPGIIMT